MKSQNKQLLWWIGAHTIIDMVETAENVWSDSCVCAMTDKDLSGKD